MSKITYIFKKLKFQILFHNNIHTYKHQIYQYIFSLLAEERKKRDEWYAKTHQAYQDVTSRLKKAGTELVDTFKQTDQNAGGSSSTDTSNGE